MTTPPGGQFNYSEDTVVARVSVDLPSGSADAFSRLGVESEKLATNLQAVARAQGDYVAYLRELPQIQQAVNSAQHEYEMSLARTADHAERIARAGGMVQTANGLGGVGATTPGGLILPHQYGGGGAAYGYGLGGMAAPTFVNPFGIGGSGGVGMGIGNAAAVTNPAAGATNPGSVAATAAHVAAVIAMMNPSMIANMQAQRGHTGDAARDSDVAAPPQPSDDEDLDPDEILPPRQSRSERMARASMYANQGVGLANDILGEMGAGGQGSMMRGATRAATRLGMLQSAGLLGRGLGAGAGGAGAGGAAGAAGAVGSAIAPLAVGAAALGAGVATYGLVQRGGQVVQSLKNVGNMYDQGISGGIEHEMQVRFMAMSPFLSTEQSRQVIMGAMSSGYSGGKTFDTVTKFMTDNLKDMSIGVNESMELMRTNVQRGGQSIESLSNQLYGLKEIAGQDGSMVSTQQLSRNYGQVANSLVSMGASGNIVGEVSSIVGSLGIKDKALNEALVSSMAASVNSPAVQALALQKLQQGPGGERYQGLPAGAVFSAMSDDPNMTGERMASMWGTGYQTAFDMTYNSGRFRDPNKMSEDVFYFWKNLQSMQINVDQGYAEKIARQMMENGGNYSQFVGAQAQANRESNGNIRDQLNGGTWKAIRRAGVGPISLNGANGVVNGIGNALGLAGATIGGVFSKFNPWHKGDNWEGAKVAANKLKGQWDNDFDGQYTTDWLDQWVQQLGGDNKIWVQDENGNLDTLHRSNRQQVENIVSGKYKISASRDGGFQTYESAYANGLGSRASGSNGANTGLAGDVAVQIDMTPEMKRWFTAQRVTTPHQDNVNSGVGNTSMNNPGPQGTTPPGGG